MTTEQYTAVSAALEKLYGITAADAGFTADEFDLHETPESFAHWWGEKYDLIPKADWGKPEHIQAALDLLVELGVPLPETVKKQLKARK